jgi:hypothetical protein
LKPTTITLLAVVSISSTALAQQPAPAADPATPAPPPAPAPAAPAAPAASATTPAPAAPASAAVTAAATPAEVSAGATAKAPVDDNNADNDDGGDAALIVRSGDWTFQPFGFIRVAYEHVAQDSRYEFIGRNNGFVLESARLGLEVRRGEELTMRVSVDGASGEAAAINTPEGKLDVNLRDAYARYDPTRYLGVQVGQFHAPFAAEEMRSTTDLLFASRALGQEGIRAGRGIETPGLEVDRQLGVMISPDDPIYFGSFGVSAYAMAANGKGPNQLLNDDSSPAFIGRLELYWKDYVRAGGAFLRNGRRAGTPPDLLDENDTGLAGDLLVTLGDLEVFGQFVQINTTYVTAGSADRLQRAWSAQAGYRIRTPYVLVTPAYRFAHLHPWASGDDTTGGDALSAFKLDYHTIGLRLEHPKLPIELHADYTLTMERDPYKIDNNRLQILTQAAF